MNTPTPPPPDSTNDSWATLIAERDKLERELTETKQQNHRLATGETLRGIREYALGLDQELREAISAVERLMNSEAKLLVERDKLRAALERILDYDCNIGNRDAPRYISARAALATEEEK